MSSLSLQTHVSRVMWLALMKKRLYISFVLGMVLARMFSFRDTLLLVGIYIWHWRPFPLLTRRTRELYIEDTPIPAPLVHTIAVFSVQYIALHS